LGSEAGEGDADRDVSKKELWSSLIIALRELFPDLPQSQTQAIKTRVRTTACFKVKEDLTLPIHEDSAHALHSCSDSVLHPGVESRAKKVSAPLQPLAYLKSQLAPSWDYMALGDLPVFHVPAKEDSYRDLAADLDKPRSDLTLSADSLMSDERLARESMVLLSHLRWTRDGLEKAQLSSESYSKEELEEVLSTLLRSQQLLLEFLEDRVVTSFANSVLRRRDLVLLARGARFLRKDLANSLRGSDFTSEVVLPIPQEVLDRQAKEEEKRMYKSLLRQVSLPTKVQLDLPSLSTPSLQPSAPPLSQSLSTEARGAKRSASVAGFQDGTSFKRHDSFRGRRGSYRGRGASASSFRGRSTYRGRGRRR